jgi:hypothetical protein
MKLFSLFCLMLSVPLALNSTVAKFSLAQVSPAAQPQKVKLYVVDGTNGRKENNLAMGILYDRYQGSKYYANGPQWDCRDCHTIMMDTAKDMCTSLRSGEATHIALSGNSRGSYLTRAALVKAQQEVCPDLNPESKLVWGGFIDPIPWGMQESNIVNNWGGWKRGVPGINIVKEINTPGFWTVIDNGNLCKAESFAVQHLPTVVVNSCHGDLNGGSTTQPSMQDFLLGKLIGSATQVNGMTFSPLPPEVKAPHSCWEEWQGWWKFGRWVSKCGVARVSERPAFN